MAIRVPIEIDSAESAEIRQLLDRIERADTKLQGLRGQGPSGGGGARGDGQADARELLRGDVSPTGITSPNQGFRQAFQRGSLNESITTRTPLGTPLPLSTEGALPRGKGGELGGEGAPEDIQRSGAFKDLQSQVDKQGGQFDKMQQSLGTAASLGGQGLGAAAALGVGGGGLGLFESLLKSAPIRGGIVAFAVIGLADAVIKELLRPGGFLDRRFRREFDREFNSAFRDRETKGLIRAGMKEIRISSGAAIRPQKGQVATTLTAARDGYFQQGNGELSWLAAGVIP